MGEYLETLGGLLRLGAETLGERFKRAQVDFFLGLRRPDGGFPGRQGPSDLYYTDFAVRSLAFLDADPHTFRPTAEFLFTVGPPRNVVECFSLLNCRRLVEYAGPGGPALPPPPEEVAEVLARQAAPGGGWAHPGGREVSAYNTFLGALCLEMLGADLPPADELERAILTLQRPSGGFAERPGEAHAQASATAAALGVFTTLDRLSPEFVGKALEFLWELQAPDGGFRAHPDAPASDLLSTFTACLSLVGLCDMAGTDMPRVGRYLRSLACEAGGFRACRGDDRPDVEYSYYGLACLTILRAML